MFTGIITDIGTVRTAEQRGDLRLVIGCGFDMETVAIGASIACSGVCLTVVDKGPDWFAVDLSHETTSRTAQGAWAAGTPDVMADAFFDDLAGYEAFTQRLIFDRNKTWATKINTMLAHNEQDLIVVGAGHLMGDGSVVDLLEKDGFEVTRLQ